jgi:glycosyltransferase involved in cell wall biosynthesis
VSNALAADLTAAFPQHAGKVLAIPDCYDDVRFTYRPREREGITRLVTVGRLVPVKGHDVLLDAFAEVAGGRSDIELTVVGGGPERATLERRARQLGLGARVVFAGPLASDALLERLRAADAFVSASRREGFGVAIVEALACGVPVVATRSGGPEDIVGEGDGILCDADDVGALAGALMQLLGRLESFDRPALATRARDRFSREAVGARLVALYRRVAPGAAS